MQKQQKELCENGKKNYVKTARRIVRKQQEVKTIFAQFPGCRLTVLAGKRDIIWKI